MHKLMNFENFIIFTMTMVQMKVHQFNELGWFRNRINELRLREQMAHMNHHRKRVC